MSDRDFELYLSALSRLLRLNAGQREGIADELRDHLEERLAELTAIGVPHDEAVRRALDEFGDAAGLAAHFTHLSKRRTRRLLMRWTMGTIVTGLVVAIAVSAFWPQAPGLPAPQAVNAQGGGIGAGAPGGMPGGAAKPVATTRIGNRGRVGDAVKNAELEKKLAQQLETVDWDGVTLKDVIGLISKTIKADIVIDRYFFSDQSYDLETQVTLKLEFSKITARTALEMALERTGCTGVAVTFRDGLIYLTSKDRDRFIEVYDCRDLLPGQRISATIPNVPLGGGLGGGFFAVASQAKGGAGPRLPPGGAIAVKKSRTKTRPTGSGAAGGISGMGSFPAGGVPGMAPGGFGGGGGGMEDGMMMGGAAPIQSNAQALIAVIQATVTSTRWMSIEGEGASIAEFGGLLVVTAGQDAHADIKQLLEKLRGIAKEKKAGK